ncbi:family 16 glycosylhydrolase [Polaribacter vadi]|uniref:family 16 glycosylhydrolase n=1 Tax=Polaribacter TaxID=52959 RepID=UPI001C0842B4|nr:MULTISPECIES: family 16 glycosylhydrolase [Polaribacter]MBU3010760.1 family 16 glycosylhydrolase [Polaribacter vadi]MDO6740571.1 family 16 glycosylhydrolase [Polaribacter sp. 1_MG-2023]
MQNFFILIALVFINSILAQQKVEDDFEGNGTISSWFGDDCVIDNSSLNPFKTDSNTSDTVLKYTDNGGQYANVRFDVPINFNLSTNSTFSVKIYVPSSGITGNETNQVSLKLQDGTVGSPWATQSEIIKPLVLDQWQTVSFDFSSDNFINLDANSQNPINRTDFNRILIQINDENNNSFVTAYIDDFIYDGTLNLGTNPVFNHLVWSDEFDGTGAIDGDKWFHQTQLPNGGSWYNGEIQHYTNRVENSSVNDGILSITAQKETFTDQGYTKNYTSARLNSKFAFKYGKIEIKAKLPTGAGTWPAIWMLGKNIIETGGFWTDTYGSEYWPACGEIDIMEHWGRNQNFVQSAMHTPSSFGGTVNHGGRSIATVSSEFHIYSLEWSSEKMVFKVDDVEHYTYNPSVKNENTWPFDKEQYLLLNIAIEPGIASSFTKSAMEIDYVRVYQEAVASVIHVNDLSKVKFYPNPVQNNLNIQLSSNLEKFQAEIYNVSGQKILSFYQNSNHKTINLSHLSKGIYFLKYETENGIKIQKIVKN